MDIRFKYPKQLRSDLAMCLVIIGHVAVTFALNKYIESAMPFGIADAANANILVAGAITALLLITTLSIWVVNKGLLKSPYGFLSPKYLVGVGLFIAWGYMVGSFAVFKFMMSEMLPFTWDHAFAEIDKALHFKDPWQYLSVFDPFYRPIVWTYAFSWHLLVLLVLFVVCVTRSKIRFRYLWGSLATAIIGGNLLPMGFMAAGPIFVERLTGSTRFSELSDRLYALADPSLPSSLLPQLLWNAYETGTPFMGSAISAFPSLHVAMATLFFLAARQYGPWLGGIALAYLVFTLLASVHLGWHYAIDGYASIAMVIGFWKFFGWIEAKQKPPTV